MPWLVHAEFCQGHLNNTRVVALLLIVTALNISV